MADLYVTLMTSVLLTGPDGSVRPSSGYERGLIARLALSRGCIVANDDVISALWGGRPPSSVRSNLRKYTSGVRAALRAIGADGALAVVPAHRGSHSSGGIRLDMASAAVDVLAAQAALESASRLLATSPRGALSEAERGIRLLSRGTFGTDLPATDWFSGHRVWIDEHRRRLREIRCVAGLVVGDLYPSALEAERLALENEGSFPHVLWAAALFFEDRCLEALNVIARHRHDLAEFGLDVPVAMTDLQVAILNSDSCAVRRVLVSPDIAMRAAAVP